MGRAAATALGPRGRELKKRPQPGVKLGPRDKVPGRGEEPAQQNMWAYLSPITTKFEFIKLACSFLCADQMHTMGATLHRDRFAFSLTIESIGAQHHHAAQSSSDPGQCCEHRPRSDPSHLEVLTMAKAVSTSTPNPDAALLDLVRQHSSLWREWR
jgi:hypothetical protein